MGFKKREKILIAIAGICIFLLLGDALLISPLARIWKERSSRIGELKKQLEKGDLIAGREESLKNRWTDMKNRSLVNDMPEAEKEVLGAVQNWAIKSGMNVLSLKPRWVNKEDESRLLECRLTGSGDLGSVTRFLFELENDSLPLRLEDVEITARDARGRDLALSIRFTGLILEEQKT